MATCFAVGCASAQAPIARRPTAGFTALHGRSAGLGNCGTLGPGACPATVAVIAVGASVAGLCSSMKNPGRKGGTYAVRPGGHLRARMKDVDGSGVTMPLPTPPFDPMGMSQDSASLESAKHLEMAFGRFAMLAAIGYPAAELYHEGLAEIAGLPSRLNENGQAPTWLNGGEFSPMAETVVVMSLVGITAAALETTSRHQKGESDFDLINPEQARQPTLSPLLKSILKEAQLVNGRAAMLAIIFMMIQEGVMGSATVDVAPFLFGVAQ